MVHMGFIVYDQIYDDFVMARELIVVFIVVITIDSISGCFGS
jgi:hypothetical protein